MRKLREVTQQQQQLIDICCDCCGESCRGQYEDDHYEMAKMVAQFNEGDTAGDRFNLEMCKDCFFDFLEWFLLDKFATVEYHNIIEQENSANLDELRIYFAHRRAGTLARPEDFE